MRRRPSGTVRSQMGRLTFERVAYSATSTSPLDVVDRLRKLYCCRRALLSALLAHEKEALLTAGLSRVFFSRFQQRES